MRKSNYLVGLLLIALGAIALVLRLFGIKILEFNTFDFWVFIVLLVGLAFELGFFLSGSKPGLLIPGGIITTIGLLFMFEVTTDWYFAKYTWPVYILSVAIGLFQMYLFSKRERGLLIASLIIGGVAAFSMACIVLSQITSILNPGVFIPIALIAAGLAIFFSGSAAKKSQY
ncbi:MAG TPA: hypothetical protein VIK78_13725 [Ruminiclostridium sp.]